MATIELEADWPPEGEKARGVRAQQFGSRCQVTDGHPTTRSERTMRTRASARTLAAAGAGRAEHPGETIPEAGGCTFMSLKPRHFRHRNIRKNKSAKTQQ